MSSYLQALKLMELRIKHNYTQSDLGKYLQMSRAGYSQYEAGERTPTYSVLLSLSQLYRISIDELINEDLFLSEIPSKKAPSIINDSKALYTLGVKCLKTKPKLDIASITDKDTEFLFKFNSLDEISRQRIILYIKTSLKLQRKTNK